ncbi:MAG: hypothetical protein IJ097_00535 [Bacilli bacterium]|nr:hypothetical protein [Bacilli bacterium]
MSNLSIVKKNYINYIDKIIENDKLSHAYLIEIDNYDDDKEYIFAFIKMILCNLTYEKVINSNSNIINLIDEGNYPDIKIVESKGSTIKKSQMLDLQKEYSNKSLLDGKRIYIIKEAEKLNASSANTMLKFLEEPEEGIIAFLLTNNRYSVLETILSRCQILTLKENCVFFNDNDDILDLLKCVLHPKNFFINYNNLISNTIIDKEMAKEKFNIIENCIIMYLNSEYENSNIDNKILVAFNDIDDDRLLKSLSIIEKEIKKLVYNVNYKLWLDSLFSKLIIGG